MEENTLSKLFGLDELPVAEAHCDAPCGVYDPASARIAAEAVRSMTKKILDLTPPEPGDTQAVASYLNTVGRYVAAKEEQAELAKHELLILWTDYFKPVHLEAYPDLHEVFWNAAKTCSGKVKAEKSRTTKQVDPNGSQRTYSVSVTKT